MSLVARGRGACRPLRLSSSPIAILTLRPVTIRHIHSSDRRTNTIANPLPESSTMPSPRAPLSVLPISTILRSLATATVSSSPLLLPPSLRIMDILANTANPVLNPDKNPLLRFFLKKTFYAQFCAGENPVEVGRTIAGLKKIGFTGVILCYAREVVLTGSQAKNLSADLETEESIKNEIIPWAEGTLETVRLAEPGDFVALKFSGAGQLALAQLAAGQVASPTLHKSIDSICQLAHDRGVRLLFDAEQDMLQDGIDAWTMEFARKYNRDSNRKAVIYGTYQSYKKACPRVLSEHLAIAQRENITLGVKLVRGAYLGSDARELFHDTKEETDACFDNLAASVMTRTWGNTVEGTGEYPHTSVVLATHNAESVRRGRAILEAGAAKAEDIAFAQLQGMADEVSCELVEADQSARKAKAEKAVALPAYKYLVWGSTGECMKYLLRRAYENKDAVQRTRGGRDAMWAELVRRCKSVVGLA